MRQQLAGGGTDHEIIGPGMPEGAGGQHVGPAFHRHLQQHGPGALRGAFAVDQRHRVAMPVKGGRHVLAAGRPVAAVADVKDGQGGARLCQGTGVMGGAHGFAGVAPADQDMRADGSRIPAFGKDQDRAARAADQLLLQLALAVSGSLWRALRRNHQIRGGHVVQQEVLGALAAQRLLPEIIGEITPRRRRLKGFGGRRRLLLQPFDHAAAPRAFTAVKGGARPASPGNQHRGTPVQCGKRNCPAARPFSCKPAPASELPAPVASLRLAGV